MRYAKDGVITLPDLYSAQSRLQGITVRTRLIEFNLADPGRCLYLKPENQQPIGAFKLRGAYNKIASLSEAERKHGVISYSTAITGKESPTPRAH